MTRRFGLDLPDDILIEAQASADEAHVSVDDLLVTIVTEAIEHRRGLFLLRERAARAHSEAAISILDRVPAIEPEPSDRIL